MGRRRGPPSIGHQDAAKPYVAGSVGRLIMTVSAALGEHPDRIQELEPAAFFALAQEVIAWRAPIR